MYSAMADLAAELDDQTLKQTCEILWKDVTAKRMYVTGGLGPSDSNEGFTNDYDLPNDTAYAETCASVALIFWAQRMLHLDCDGSYGDVLELALYNGALAGLSRDGVHYFYENRLESDGSHQRWQWHSCPCCTMNVSRLIASVGGYFYATGEDTIAVHLYGANSARLSVGGRSCHCQANHGLPVAERHKTCHWAATTSKIRSQAAHSGVGPWRDGQDQWRSVGFGPQRARICGHRAGLESR